LWQDGLFVERFDKKTGDPGGGLARDFLRKRSEGRNEFRYVGSSDNETVVRGLTKKKNYLLDTW